MEAIIFDVDGTLWDSTEEVAVSWNRTLEEHSQLNKRLTGEILKKEFGKPLKDIVESLFPELSENERDELAKYLYLYENEWVKTAPCILYDKMPETIQLLSQKYKLFIVSNCQSGYIEAFLENTGLAEYIEDYTCPGDTGKLKAENIRIIMERNQVKTAVYVGDTKGDADACQKAGIGMIYAAYGFGEVTGCYKEIQSFDELPEIMGQIDAEEKKMK